MKIIRYLILRFEDILQFFYPPVCIVCQNIKPERGGIQQVCPACLTRCQPVPADFIRRNILDRLSPCYLDGLTVCFRFDETIQTIIHHLKYQKMNRLGTNASRWGRELLNDPSFEEGIDLVIPVPLHPSREKERGFNQSYYVSRGFFGPHSALLRPDALSRTRATRSQTELSRLEREQNVSGAFRIRHLHLVEGKTVALVDDVVTTGATLNECARALKKTGAARVIGITMATPVD